MMLDRFITHLILLNEVCIESAMTNNLRIILQFILNIVVNDIIKSCIEVGPTCSRY